SASLQIELHPIRSGRPSYEIEFVFVEIEKNGIADNVAVPVTRHELLRLVDLEILEAVYTEVGKQLERFGTFDIEVGHMVRLVEQRACLTPGALLVAPIREFRPDDGKCIWSDLRVAQELNGIVNALQYVFQASLTHVCITPSRGAAKERSPGRQPGIS